MERSLKYYPALAISLILFCCTKQLTVDTSMQPDSKIVRYDSSQVALDTLYDTPIEGYEYIPDLPDDLIRDRLGCIEGEINLSFNRTVRSFIDYFTIADRAYTRLMIRRKNLYFPVFEAAFKKYDLPEELKYLAIVESGLNPKAVSRAGATGLWQFMYYTGKMFDMKQTRFIDERMAPYQSTEAACKYLKQLYNIFNDWELALAAYNCGPGKVRRAIRRSGYKRDFWKIYNFLPRETRGYVPSFVAVNYALNYAEHHNIFVDTVEYPIISDTIIIQQTISLSVFAGLIGVCEDDLNRLNPEVKSDIIPQSEKKYPLKVPSDKKEFIVLNRAFIMDSASCLDASVLLNIASGQITGKNTNYPDKVGTGRKKIVYTVKKGDVLGKVAEKYHVRISQIRAWNNIKGTMIRTGQKLTIWKDPAYFTKYKTKTVSVKPVPIPKGKIHYVQPGDTLWDISRKYEGVTIDQLKELNNLKSNKIKPGQKLKLG
ncbi:MAG: LysM peptidoglycan-binding domain-containing protein [Cytophagales bacterium]|nr:LysM peptidoglycan-binding domain-containing protein [Cytophagales bacterium]